MKGQRSSAYPSYTLLYCLNLCETIYKNYGTAHRATREELAKVLNLSVGNIIMKISSCTQYGLLDMKSKEGYKVSDLFVKYHRPINEKQALDAKIQAFKSPTLYEALISSFEGGILPPAKPLSNILLQKHSISESACESAAEIFIENAQLLGVLSNDNVLNLSLDNDIQEEIEEFIPEIVQESSQSKTSNAIVISEEKKESNQRNAFINNSSLTFNVLLKGKRTAQLILPDDVETSDMDTIVSQIMLMKQTM